MKPVAFVVSQRAETKAAAFDNSLRYLRVLLLVAAGVALCGCQMVGKTKPDAATYRTLMSQADASASAGDRDAALADFKRAADADPAKAKPWERTAQLQFTAKDYGRAIVAAKEALSRDPSSWIADSVLTVSGLRVAVQSLARLHQKAKLSGSTRSEAMRLAKSLRETLGESVLLPDAQKDTKAASKKSTHHRRRHVAHRAHHNAASAAASKSASKQDTSEKDASKKTDTPNNPFNVLKQSGNGG